MKGALRRFARIFGGAPVATMPSSPVSGQRSPALAIQSAVGFHQAGRLREAEAIYRQVLSQDPDNFDALHLTGVIAQQEGDSARAVELMIRAIAIAPSNPSAHCNLALAYQSLNRLDDAEAALGKALALKPDWDQAHNNQGVRFQVRGDLDEAEAWFAKAHALNPSNTDALANLGGVCRDRGNLAGAEDYYRRALALRPDCAEAHNGLGTIFQAQGKLNEAESCFHDALDARGDFATAFCNLGDVVQALGRLDEAEAFCRKALALQPDYADALNGLGLIFKRRSNLDEAEACFRKALSLDPGHARSHNNLGTIFNEQGKLHDAQAAFRNAVRFSPNDVPKYNLAMNLLLLGDYPEGSALYESRFDAFKHNFAGARDLRQYLKEGNRWRGGGVSGKRVLVWCEQGLGDSVMMMRYLPALKERGAESLTVFCDPSLERVMRSIDGVDEVVCQVGALSSVTFDLHCPIMSLPHRFGTRQDTIPGVMPYLAVPEALRAQWSERFSRIAKMKVGLAWAGSAVLRDDSKRSIPLDQFAPLTEIGGVQLISLQKGEAAKQLAGWGRDIPDWMGACGDFMDTAALVSHLDLVISVDTAIVHLAGALGKPVWLLNRYESEWRWGLEREDTPWYPSMKIFRQQQRSEWHSTIERIAIALRALASR